MYSLVKHVVFKQTAYLLIIGSLLIVLFGSGLHLHSVFDHFFDHGDVHTIVHAHPANSDVDHNPEFDGKDVHQHPTATVDLTGTLTQNSKNNALQHTDIMAVSGVLSSQLFSQTPEYFFTDLPPPDFLHPSNYFRPVIQVILDMDEEGFSKFIDAREAFIPDYLVKMVMKNGQ